MTVPNNINLPGAYLSISNVRAVTGLTAPEFDTVFMGQRVSTGTVAEKIYTQIFSAADAELKFGAGSQLADMLKKYFENNTLNRVYAVALDDAPASTAGTLSLAATGTTTAAGTLFLYINGVQLQVGIASGADPTAISTAVIAAVNADNSFPVTASADTTDVTLTAKNKGTIGNDIDVRVNYQDTDEFPAGLTAYTIATGITGATDPDLDDAIGVLPDDMISLFVNPYTDATNLGKLKTEITRRFGPTVQLEGHAITAKGGSVSTVGSFTNTINDEFLTVLDAGNGRPTPPYAQLGALAGVMAASLGADPGRPLQTLPLLGVLPEIKDNLRLFNERNSLIDDGCSAITVTKAGVVTIERLCTTYLTNASSTRDKSYQNTTTMFTSSYLRQTLIVKIQTTYPRHKLGNDGTRYAANQPVATPKMITGTILGWFTQLEELALVEEYEQFKRELTVVRDPNDNDRVNSVLPTDYINQFRIFAGEIQFIL
jgi:phage tail sheath gpL-like